MKLCFQTKIITNQDFLLDAAKLFSTIERKLYAELSKEDYNVNELKKEFLKKYKISARHFNSIYKILIGKIKSYKELLKLRVFEANEKVKSLERYIKKIEKKIKLEKHKKNPNYKLIKRQKNVIHQKKRKLYSKKLLLTKLENDKKINKSRICFGSKKLFFKQFNLEENNYLSHYKWLKDFQEKRNSQFNLVGSKDEASGNQSCIATINPNESINLKLKIPESLENKYGKFITIKNIELHYGKKDIIKAIKENETRRLLSLKANQVIYKDKYKQHGQAITYKFKYCSKKNNWYVFISIDVEEASKKVYEGIGNIGIDINVNHLAAVETDMTGNPIDKLIVKTNTYGKNKEQAKAIIGDACKKIIEYSIKKNKPLILENLDFVKKKASLKEQSKKHARMLSSFAYSMILNCLNSRAHRYGSKIHLVNPAFSSVIGRVKFAKRYGLSIHQSAALVLSRRYSNFSERIPKCLSGIPDGKGGDIALPQTVSIEGKHLWHTWGKILGKLQAVLAEQFKVNRYRQKTYTG